MKGRSKRAGGGEVGGGAMKVSGNPNVFAEAAKRKRGGRAPKPMTDVGFMTGGAVKERLDRPGRKKGGRVGANNSPLSTAHGTSSAPSAPRAQVGPAD